MPGDAEVQVACNTCGLVQRLPPLGPGLAAECERCGALIEERKAGSAHVTGALAAAALILYVPANVFPILRLYSYGLYTENTVWQGVVALWRDGQWPVAAIVFLASMVIPLAKLMGLFYLVASAKVRRRRGARFRTRLHRFIELIGPWAMLDVFLLAILVALVRLGKLATVLPGAGLLSFTVMVVLTILASASFDPKLLWEGDEP